MLRAGFAIALLTVLPAAARAEDHRAATTAADEADPGATDPDLASDPVVGGADLVTGEEAAGMVAFTFDDGPQAGLTDKILDALVAYDIPGAFFIVGKHLDGKQTDRADKAAKLIQREISLGFLVGNHTYAHAHVTTLKKDKLAWQIDHTTKQLRAITGQSLGLFRPPYGHLSPKVEAFLAKRGLTPVKWNLDSRDWEGATSEEMRKKALLDIRRKNGGVILFHDTKKVTARTIAKIFDDLEAYNCKRLAAGKPIIQPVSLHYFLRDDGVARPVPADVAARTQAYRDKLQGRCDARTSGKQAHR